MDAKLQTEDNPQQPNNPTNPTNFTPDNQQQTKSRSPLRRLYHWVLSWAESKYGTLALCILAFVESSFFPVPPDVLQISLSIARPRRSFWYALLATIFSILGGILGYFIGYFLYESIGSYIINLLGYEQYFVQVGELFSENAFLAIFAAALTPIPYKVFTIASGVWNIGLPVLVAASALGRGSRFFLVAAFTFFLGDRVRTFVDRYLNLLSIGLFLLILTGVLAIKYLT